MNESPLQQAVRALGERAQREAIEKRKQETVSVLAALYDKAATYTNLILAGGYAGFFAVWSTMKDRLTTVESLIAALSVSCPLAIFVFWELGVMLFTAKNLDGVQKALAAPPGDFDRLMEAAKADQAQRAVSVRRMWFVVLVATIIPGVIGAGVLMYAFVRLLIKSA